MYCCFSSCPCMSPAVSIINNFFPLLTWSWNMPTPGCFICFRLSFNVLLPGFPLHSCLVFFSVLLTALHTIQFIDNHSKTASSITFKTNTVMPKYDVLLIGFISFRNDVIFQTRVKYRSYLNPVILRMAYNIRDAPIRTFEADHRSPKAVSADPDIANQRSQCQIHKFFYIVVLCNFHIFN